jgi:hypothetical protein
MVTFCSFGSMMGLDQLEVLMGEGVCLAEGHTAGGSSLYYSVGDFYVELIFLPGPEPCVGVIPFTRDHPAFDELLEALPLDPSELLRGAA